MNLSLNSCFLTPGLPLSNDFRLELNYHSSSWQKPILTIGHEVLPAPLPGFQKKKLDVKCLSSFFMIA